MLHTGSAIHTFTMNAAAALGEHLNVRIQVRSFDAVCKMVSAGVGIGLVPQSAVTLESLKKHLHIIQLDEHWAQRDLQICLKNNTVLSTFAQKLVTQLTEK
jgi:DNA-binding transcriptional LysR family regulator